MATTTFCLYPPSSVFTVMMRQGVQAGWVSPPPNYNHASFDIAVVEFDNEGMRVDQSQLVAAANCISHAREANRNGAIVIVFIHGWHHGAYWDVTKNEGDTHFSAFRRVLASLTLREAERYIKDDEAARRVVGIYFGWNGDPAISWLRRPGLNLLTFRNRYRTAKSIGDSEHIREAIRTIVARTKDPMVDSHGPPETLRPESPLILVGHSMGALMLESAFLALLQAKDQPLLGAPNPTSCVKIRRGGDIVSFPDLLLALNSAADSRIATDIKDEMKRQEITKTVVADGIHYSPPLFISVTSTADLATKILWRAAQLPRVWRVWRRKTDGHDCSLFTHRFRKECDRVSCERRESVDFGQNWHCLRRPTPLDAPTPSFAIDLPVRERQGKDGLPDHARYQLEPLGDVQHAQLAWVFQVPPEIVACHNDIFNSRSSSLIMALIQISGAIMSLAEDFQRNFE